MKPNRIIISGGRDFSDWELLKTKVSYYILNLDPKEVEIVSGGCRGADKLGERYAKEYGYPLKVFEADWRKNGDIAGKIRNQQMADYGTHLITFWDGKSTGTRHMIGRARQKHLILKIVLY